MQLVPEPAKVALLVYGSTCQAQALRDVLVYFIAVANLSALLGVKAAAFEAGLEPCRRFALEDAILEHHGVNYSRKCNFYTEEIYDESAVLLALSMEDLFAARSLMGGDPGRKLYLLEEYLGMSDNADVPLDPDQLYEFGGRVTEKLTEMVNSGKIK